MKTFRLALLCKGSEGSGLWAKKSDSDATKAEEMRNAPPLREKKEVEEGRLDLHSTGGEDDSVHRGIWGKIGPAEKK